MTALERAWHPECFVCADCGGAFGDGGYHEREGKPFCADCFSVKFAPKCAGCQVRRDAALL